MNILFDKIENWAKEKKGLFKTCFLCVFVWGLLAHAFRFFNISFNHDSSMFVTTDQKWQISLGRFIQPIYAHIRGEVNAPWLVGVISLFFMSLAVFLICDVLKIWSKAFIVVISGMMIVNISTICVYGSFLYLSDIFFFALFCSVLAEYITFKYKYGFTAGGILLAISLGCYQAYVSVFLVFAAVLFLCRAIENRSIKKTACLIVRNIMTVIIGAVAYLIMMKLSFMISEVSMSDSYNSPTKIVSDITLIPGLVRDLYYHYSNLLFGAPIHIRATKMIVSALLVITTFLIAYVFVKKKIDLFNIFLFISMIVLLPIGSYCIYILTSGFMRYPLQQYAIWMWVLIPIILVTRSELERPYINIAISMVTLLFVLIIGNMSIFANQVYAKKKLVYDSTQEIFNRMLYMINTDDEYTPGETPVVIIGDLEHNDYFKSDLMVEGFKPMEGVLNLDPYVAVTYEMTYSQFIQYSLNEKIRMIPKDSIDSEYDTVFEEMDIFPSDECFKMIDGVMYVRVS